MIFVHDKGRMANNILQYGHVYAWGREHNRPTMSMRFAYKYPYFHICHTRHHNFATYAFAKYAAKLHLIPTVHFDEPDGDTSPQERVMMNRRMVMVTGWEAHWYDLFLKYKADIIQLFTFDAAVEKQSQRLMAEVNNPDFKDEDMYRITEADLAVQQSEKVRPLDEVLNELDEFIGMRSVKNMIRRLAVQSMFMKQRAAMGAGKVQQMAMNFILTGNPGTGKTSIARKMGEVLQSMEILPTSRVIEASRATLVGKYMGETPKIVNNMCDKAMGGILFIDEAYTLSSENDQYGKEAIDTLMKRMEDDRGKFVVIAAGYQKEMEDFMNVNPGLASRFTHKMHIEDYNEDELLAIFKKMASKDNYTLSPAAEFKLMDLICRKVVSKSSSFGNAREMRNLLDETIQQLSVRVSGIPQNEVTQETYQMILLRSCGNRTAMHTLWRSDGCSW